MEEKTLHRIKKYLDFKGINVSSFEKSIGMSNGSFASQLKNNKTIGVDKLENILKNYTDINYEWLLTGVGEMIRSKKAVDTTNNNTQNNKIQHLIPLYDGIVTAGMQVIADNSPQFEPVEYINVGDLYKDATAAMRIHGDSAEPDYTAGSIAILREQKNKRLVVPGQDYVIETSEYRVLKRLQRSEYKNNWLACSINQNVWEQGALKGRLIHEPFDIAIDDVDRLFQVIGNVIRNTSSRIVKL